MTTVFDFVVDKIKKLNQELATMNKQTGNYGPRKKVIYVAGAYRDERGEYYVQMNIREAERAAFMIWQLGGVALCPHKNTAGFGGAHGLLDNTWLNGDLELLHRCDAIYMCDNAVASEGAQFEMRHAREWGLPVLVNMLEVKAFIDRQG